MKIFTKMKEIIIEKWRKIEKKSLEKGEKMDKYNEKAWKTKKKGRNEIF